MVASIPSESGPIPPENISHDCVPLSAMIESQGREFNAPSTAWDPTMNDPFAWSFPFGRLFGINLRIHVLFPQHRSDVSPADVGREPRLLHPLLSRRFAAAPVLGELSASAIQPAGHRLSARRRPHLPVHHVEVCRLPPRYSGSHLRRVHLD